MLPLPWGRPFVSPTPFWPESQDPPRPGSATRQVRPADDVRIIPRPSLDKALGTKSTSPHVPSVLTLTVRTYASSIRRLRKDSSVDAASKRLLYAGSHRIFHMAPSFRSHDIADEQSSSNQQYLNRRIQLVQIVHYNLLYGCNTRYFNSVAMRPFPPRPRLSDF
jgi:hypothetical protein